MSPGTAAIEWMASVFFFGTGQLIHDVVDSATCVSYMPVRARTDRRRVQVRDAGDHDRVRDSPRSSATSRVTVPTTLPNGCSGGR